MAHRAGGRAPYAAVSLIYGLTEDPVLATYIRGKLALAGIDLSTDLGTWLDAVWTCMIDAPVDTLKAANAEMTKGMARIRPEAARETWGLLPEHQVQAGRLSRGSGAEAGTANLPPAAHSGATARDVDQWTKERLQRQQRPGRR